MRTARRVTLRNVAEASGVSQSTVSFVLNEVPNQTISEHAPARGRVRTAALYGFALLVRHGHPSKSDAEQIANVIAPRAVLQFGEVYLTGHELEDSGGGRKNGMAARVLLQFRYLSERGHSQIGLALPEAEPLAGVRERFVLEVAETLGLDTSDVKTKIGRVIPRESA
jgi:hypothetical protein